MGDLQKSVFISTLLFTLLCFKRYLDDIVACIPKDKLQVILDTFNIDITMTTI